MISIKERLLSGEEKISDILSEHVELINSLYNEAIALSFGEESSTEESHATACTIVALSLLNNREKIEYPLSFDCDESIIHEMSDTVDFILQLEMMVSQGNLKRDTVNGKALYSNGDKPIKKKKKK